MPLPNNTLLETDIMRTFVAISEVGNFSAAAKRVNRTPSAISMQVKKLEEQLGRPLFNREGRTVSLTSDGESLLGFAHEMLRINHDAITRFQAPVLEGKVRFGAPDDFGTRFLPNILKRFSTTHPLVEVDVKLAPSNLLLEELESGDIDLTLLTAVKDGINDGLGEVVHTEPLVWAGIKGGKAYKQSPLPLALASNTCSWRCNAIEVLAKAAISYRIAYTSENCQGQLAALMGDLAIAPLPESLIDARLQRLPEESGLPQLSHYDIRLCNHKNLGQAALAFANHVKESFHT